ncbi:hypothetical protein CR513_04158, partial [Mucuna pruriens]
MLIVKNNSQLVTGQVKGKYQARIGTLEEFILLHVPCEQNERVDLLAKLVSTQKGGLHKTVIPEALGHPTIDSRVLYTVQNQTVTYFYRASLKQWKVEAANRVILRGLCKQLEEAKG